ncbi:MAG: sigma-70 family RNA polymerase sigma factor [Clostridia bacterium]|nr:sigma-70 family RNA polymerase sigma factor [Clostridia bacterium]MBQ8290130.1 sigma-70 family RNA polymerase sigma factor [Clostridia bacterium]
MKRIELCGVDTSSLKTLSEEEKRELLRRTREGDMSAREELALGNIRLVLSVIRRFSPKNDTMEDLFQVGCVGLLKAIDNFNPEFDVRFSTYAVPMIIGEIRRFQRDNNSVRVSRGIRDLAYRALQVREKFTADEGREPSCAEIAGILGEPERDVEEATLAVVEPVSLFDSVYNDGEDSVYVIDQLRDETQSDEILIENIALAEAMKKLTGREGAIIRKRFYKGRTQMEIADEIGISQAQVSRLEKGAIDKLRRYMR